MGNNTLIKNINIYEFVKTHLKIKETYDQLRNAIAKVFINTGEGVYKGDIDYLHNACDRSIQEKILKIDKDLLYKLSNDIGLMYSLRNFFNEEVKQILKNHLNTVYHELDRYYDYNINVKLITELINYYNTLPSKIFNSLFNDKLKKDTIKIKLDDPSNTTMLDGLSFVLFQIGKTKIYDNFTYIDLNHFNYNKLKGISEGDIVEVAEGIKVERFKHDQFKFIFDKTISDKLKALKE